MTGKSITGTMRCRLHGPSGVRPGAELPSPLLSRYRTPACMNGVRGISISPSQRRVEGRGYLPTTQPSRDREVRLRRRGHAVQLRACAYGGAAQQRPPVGSTLDHRRAGARGRTRAALVRGRGACARRLRLEGRARADAQGTSSAVSVDAGDSRVSGTRKDCGPRGRDRHLECRAPASGDSDAGGVVVHRAKARGVGIHGQRVAGEVVVLV